MTDDGLRALEALLAETEAAHGVHEATELNGVYDEQWPQWYAGYAMEHAIGAVIGRPITAEALAELLATGWQAFQAADPQPTETWHAFLARRILEGA